MALILGIDVTGTEGLVSLSLDGVLLDHITHHEQMQHASFLQPAIYELLKRNNKKANQLNAVAVSNGPGSYTGLRVGLASAKGLCFALNIPILAINSLQLLALAASLGLNEVLTTGEISPGADKDEMQHLANHQSQILYCPMVDARRMEVFYGIYDGKNIPVTEPGIAILGKDFLGDYLSESPMVFTGSGASKWSTVTSHPNAHFLPQPAVAKAFTQIAFDKYKAAAFSELVSLEPFYYKSFYDPKIITKK